MASGQPCLLPLTCVMGPGFKGQLVYLALLPRKIWSLLFLPLLLDVLFCSPKAPDLLLCCPSAPRYQAFILPMLVLSGNYCPQFHDLCISSCPLMASPPAFTHRYLTSHHPGSQGSVLDAGCQPEELSSEVLFLATAPLHSTPLCVLRILL